MEKFTRNKIVGRFYGTRRCRFDMKGKNPYLSDKLQGISGSLQKPFQFRQRTFARKIFNPQVEFISRCKQRGIQI